MDLHLMISSKILDWLIPKNMSIQVQQEMMWLCKYVLVYVCSFLRTAIDN